MDSSLEAHMFRACKYGIICKIIEINLNIP